MKLKLKLKSKLKPSLIAEIIIQGVVSMTEANTLKNRRKQKQQDKLKMATASLAILGASILSIPHGANAVTFNQEQIPHTIKTQSLTSQSDLVDYAKLYKDEQIRIENEKRVAAVKAEQERIQREQEAAQLKKDKENFFYIAHNRDMTYTDLRTPSGLTIEEANAILEGTGLDGLGEGFVNAEKNNGVNAYYLMAHAAWESTWGTSDLARYKNNLFGFTAYDASPGTSATSFASKAECINHVAAYIKQHYLTSNGEYHNGPNLHGMNINYASDDNWADGIGDVIVGLVHKAEKLNI